MSTTVTIRTALTDKSVSREQLATILDLAKAVAEAEPAATVEILDSEGRRLFTFDAHRTDDATLGDKPVRGGLAEARRFLERMKKQGLLSNPFRVTETS